MSEAKRCIVLGGSGTVGRAVVSELTGQGAKVAFTYHQNARAAEALGATGAFAKQLDLADPDAIAPALAALADRLGGVDALVVCAVKTSTVEPAKFDDLDDVTLAGWDTLMAINVRAAFFACRALLPHFNRGGNVVFLGSVDGVKPVPSPAPYAASKAALQGLTLSLAKALGKREIRVNLIAPGVLEEGASRTLPDDLLREYLKHAGLRRKGRVDEVAGVVGFFALENTYVTGQTVLVDGGL